MKQVNIDAETQETRNTVSLYGVTPYLRGIIGEYAGFDIPVLSTGILLGRDSNVCQLIFSNDTSVSRFHCRVSYDFRTGFFIITDLNSSNGILTEDRRRIQSGGKLVLIPGQKFMLCDERIVFEVIVKQENSVC